MTSDTALIENNGIPPDWGCNPFWSDSIVTVRNVVAARLLFSQASVILFTGGGGVSQHALGQTPPIPGQTTPPADITWADPPGQIPPPPHQRSLQRTVRILLECIFVSIENSIASFIAAFTQCKRAFTENAENYRPLALARQGLFGVWQTSFPLCPSTESITLI